MCNFSRTIISKWMCNFKSRVNFNAMFLYRFSRSEAISPNLLVGSFSFFAQIICFLLTIFGAPEAEERKKKMKNIIVIANNFIDHRD